MANEKAAAKTSASTKAKARAKSKVEPKDGGGFNMVDSEAAARARLAAMDISTAGTAEIREALACFGLIMGVEVGGA